VEIDLGEEKPRQVCACINEFFTPEQLVGKQVVVVANLKPRMLRGIESHGMILALKTEDGMQLLTSTATVPTGTKAS